MTRHPLQAVLEDLDYQPAPGFRESLRTQLLADLAATHATQSGPHIDADEPQEVTGVKKVDPSRSAPPLTRALIGIAAAVVIAAGVTAVIVNHPSSPTTPVDNGADFAIARAALDQRRSARPWMDARVHRRSIVGGTFGSCSLHGQNALSTT